MMKQIFKIVLATLLFSFCIFAQENDNINNDCPRLFTHSKHTSPEITIIKIEVKDSGNYSSPPKFRITTDSLSKLFVYPDIGRRAEIEGTVKLLIKIDSIGNVVKGVVLKGIGAGLEDSVLNVLLNEKFYPAMKDNKEVGSEIVLDIEFDLSIYYDQPNFELDEIKYELHGGLIYFIKTIIFNREGEAFFSEDRGYESPKKWLGKISQGLYTKLSDFIISQCFNNYENEYISGSPTDAPKTIITIKSGDLKKSVTSQGQGYDPIGFWAITKVILKLKEEIKWEEVKD